MTAASYTQLVNDLFFAPITPLVLNSPSTRACPEFSDLDFVRLGIQRVLEASPSGRGFLQEHGARFAHTPSHTNYFDTLRSERRGQLLDTVHDALAEVLDPRLVDRLAHIPELALYECFACDGHWHRAATHDPRHDGAKLAVGHFYSLNLRRDSLRHLACAEGLHEHDMSALKRVKPRGLRQGVARGRRVLVVYDKAGIDFQFWKRCRQECAVYFLSLVKEDMVYDWIKDRDWDREDPRHHGVQSDRSVMTREGVELRIVEYINPVDGERFAFLTNEPDLPPGVIAELYRRRWEIEKVFDEIKNKLCERKAWGTSVETRSAQARLIAITHNLLLAYQQHLENEHDIQNRPEDRRRIQRTTQAQEQALQAGRPLTTLVRASRRATQCCVKFIRWLRSALRDQLTEDVAVDRLQTLYASP